MVKQVTYCENHPDVVSTDVCCQCKKYICYNCRLEILGNTFCGTQCFIVFLTRRTIRFVSRLVNGLLKGIIWPFQSIKKCSGRCWFEWILGLGLLVCAYFIWNLNHKIQGYERLTSIQLFEEGVVDTTLIETSQVFTPTEGGMVTSNVLDIEGVAEDNRIISLSIDDQLQKVTLVEDGQFVLEDIQLHRGQNHLVVRAMTEEGQVSILQTLDFTYAPPSLSYLAEDVRQGNLTKKHVALTFDGGSTNNIADEILDILKEKNVKSTFFLTGAFIRNYPNTVKRIVNEGHEVGNHTWSHPKMTSFEVDGKQNTLPGITTETVRTELSRTASLFQLITGQKMAGLWRSPYGYYNQEILMWAAEAGFKHVGWTVGQGWEESMDTLDWVADKNSSVYRSAEEIAEKILNYGKGRNTGANGAIILMHLGSEREDDFPHRKLSEIIDGLRQDGYQLLTISKMLAD
ncbi:polysaccharide deacetylase family protein [bacterium]|nr:polysaccharide deacetylase family protein [bacterium]RQV98040.1 MAG: polysaccharide deacetylase family protein [bacterium]